MTPREIRLREQIHIPVEDDGTRGDGPSFVWVHPDDHRVQYAGFSSYSNGGAANGHWLVTDDGLRRSGIFYSLAQLQLVIAYILHGTEDA